MFKMVSKLKNSSTFRLNTALLPKTQPDQHIIFHGSYGILEFRLKDVLLLTFKNQREARRMSLDDVMYRIESESHIILGWAALELCLKHEAMIPVKWKIVETLDNSPIYFLGDIYGIGKKKRLVNGVKFINGNLCLITNSTVNKTGFGEEDRFAVLKRD